MFSGEATNTYFIVFDLTKSGVEPTIYRTQGDHPNHYKIDAVYQILNKTDTLEYKNLSFFKLVICTS
jgi:hypothetical protein